MALWSNDILRLKHVYLIKITADEKIAQMCINVTKKYNAT